jgi:hypothetical protein
MNVCSFCVDLKLPIDISHDISDFVPWPTKHMTEEMGRHPNKSREFRRTYLKNPRIGALYETLPLTC